MSECKFKENGTTCKITNGECQFVDAYQDGSICSIREAFKDLVLSAYTEQTLEN